MHIAFEACDGKPKALVTAALARFGSAARSAFVTRRISLLGLPPDGFPLRPFSNRYGLPGLKTEDDGFFLRGFGTAATARVFDLVIFFAAFVFVRTMFPFS